MCGEPAITVALQPSPLTLQGVTGRQHYADTIVIDGNNELTEDLVVVAEKSLTINGSIQTRHPRKVGDPSPSVTLVCRGGDVLIAAGAMIVGGDGAPGADAQTVGTAQSDAGTNGGHVLILGVNIIHEGEIYGANGGQGGEARASAGPESAVAVAGCGGYAGHVLLCAVESIKLREYSLIRGGDGGNGGAATAHPSHFGESYARAGDSSDSGSVYFESRTAAGCLVLIEAGATVRAGNGSGRGDYRGFATPALAQPNLRGSGGNAEGIGGAGAIGGDVVFGNCHVDNRGGVVKSGDGGKGGQGHGYGGEGWSVPAGGHTGGNASATGGAGAPAGAQPEWVDLAGQLQKGTQGDYGWGGDAIAVGGDGGNAAPGNMGGASGSSEAIGGVGGNGQAALLIQHVSQPATTNDGAWAIDAPSPGGR